jgi:gamma-D-glutamyl-L-lysine dipeptidyl-peptidase
MLMRIYDNRSRHLIMLLLLLLIICTLACCTTPAKKDIQSEIDSISVRFVPDKRLGICKITSSEGGKNTLILTGETTDIQAKREIIKTLDNKGISLIDSIIVLPDTINNEKYLGLVTLSVINLRKDPDHRAELVSQAILGTPVMVLKNKGSWLLIQTPDKYIAWTESSSVNRMRRTEMNLWKKSERVIYLENSGWIYSGLEQSSIVGDLVAGSILQKSGESQSYVNVILPDGRKGVVIKKDVMSFDTFRSQTINNADGVIKRAISLLGVPYLWGGSSTKGVDCSGFVQTVYFNNGLILLRDASLQALHGRPVDISGGFGLLREGDLLFFGSKVNTDLHVTHVAIYMGDSEYINSSGRVIVNSLDSTRTNYNSYRKKSLLAARRIIDVNNDPGIVPVIRHLWY